jgi:hypothetical protein
MSTSESERPPHGFENDLHHLSGDPLDIPEDFSADDLAFALELDDLFDVRKEEAPPYFAQTLLESNDPRFQSVEAEFEKKTSARVFRRLHLRRRLFRSSVAPWQPFRSVLPARRSIRVALVTMMLLLALSVVFTAPSFASGLSILLAGPHSGVLQVHTYPTGLATTAHASTSQPGNRHLRAAHSMSLIQAQQLLHFSLQWPDPDAVPASYTLNTIYLYNRANQSWADGPIVELDYGYSFHGINPGAVGHIAICEFKPVGKILQMVQLGSAHELAIDARGNATAIYVDGRWTSINKSVTWSSSAGSELIYEKDGVIFWIVGSQGGKATSQVLSNIAFSLTPMNVVYAMRMGHVMNTVLQSQNAVPDSLVGDVIYLNNPDNPDGPMLKVVGADGAAI